MSITVRLYNQKELEDIKDGKDLLLATIFMNRKTFSEHEVKYYPYNLRKVYIISFHEQDESIEVYATDDITLKQFLSKEYDFNAIDSIEEKVISYRKVL